MFVANSNKEKGIKSKSWILNPNEKVSYEDNSMELEKSRVKNENYLAWKEGWLRFSGTPLKTAFDQLSEFYNIKFHLKEDIPEDISLSGNFRTDSLQEILEVIELSLDLKIQHRDHDTYSVQSTKDQ